MATSKLSAFSDDKRPSYTFKSNFLTLQYGRIVANWFAAEIANSAAQEAQQTANAFETVAIQVSSRFVTALGAPFPSALLCSTIATQLSEPSSSIIDARVRHCYPPPVCGLICCRSSSQTQLA